MSKVYLREVGFFICLATLPTVQVQSQSVQQLSDNARQSDAQFAKPNIVYILADDLGVGDVQTLNPQRGRIRTPHLDRLASEGMSFEDAHSGSSVCTPTRYGLLTGRYAWRTHLQRGVLDGTDDPPLIAPDRLTVASLLKENGYKTAVIGKWHLGFRSELPGQDTTNAKKRESGSKNKKRKTDDAGLPIGSKVIDGPITRGFDYFWGCSNARTMSGLIENEVVVESINPIEMLPRLGQRAVDYIESNAAQAKAGTPFFLYVPLTAPHTPILPTFEWQGKSGLGSYADFVMQTDAVVGKLLTALDKAELTENTLVFFTSDNGCSPAAGTKELEKNGHYASASLRGYKADIWEGGHRVPFLARWPNKIAPGSKSTQTICHVDFMATCADILRISIPPTAGEDSVSILPVLLGRDSAPIRQATVHHSIDGVFSIREGKWKLIFGSGSGGWGSPRDREASEQGLPDIQLYDVTNDLGETKNLQAEYPAVVSNLTSLMQKYIDSGRSTPGNTLNNDSPVSLFKKTAKSPAKTSPKN